jgi:hypothetical protein
MKPFLNGKKNLGVEPLRIPPGMGVHGASCSTRDTSPGGKLSGPTVEVVKEGDKICAWW